MISIEQIRKLDNKIIILGSHPGIIQSILDFDYLSGKSEPSVISIIASGRRTDRFFWGESEVVIPVVDAIQKLSKRNTERCTAVINTQSARRVFTSSVA